MSQNTSLQLFIKDLIIGARHGVHQREKEQAQRFKISVELSLESTKALTSDKLEDTLNWSQLKTNITEVVENNTYNLMEHLAQAIADRILTDKRVSKTIVTIDKLDAFDNGIPGVRLEIGQKQN